MPGANPFGGNYGNAPPTSTQQQDTANNMGTAVQGLLGYGLNNPNPQAGSPLTSASTNLALNQAANPNPYLDSGLTTGATNAVNNQLANPNPYNATNIQQMMSVLQTPIQEQQQADIAGVQGNMASRGLYDSTTAQGALQDVNTAAGRAQTSIASQLLQQAAAAQQAGENSAIGNASGLEGELAGQYQTGVNSAIGNTAGLANQAFNQQQTGTNNAINNLLGYSNQNFNQNLATNQENQAQQQQAYQQAMQMLGMS